MSLRPTGSYSVEIPKHHSSQQCRDTSIIAHHEKFEKYECQLYIQPHIVPVCLPSSRRHFAGSKAWVTGWGKVHDGFSHDFQSTSHIQNPIRPIISSIREDIPQKRMFTFRHCPNQGGEAPARKFWPSFHQVLIPKISQYLLKSHKSY